MKPHPVSRGLTEYYAKLENVFSFTSAFTIDVHPGSSYMMHVINL